MYAQFVNLKTAIEVTGNQDLNKIKEERVAAVNEKYGPIEADFAKEKEVNQTPVILIFITDDVLLFPDNDDIHDN